MCHLESRLKGNALHLVVFMKVISIIGARPQFIKAAVVSRALKTTKVEEYVIHTGQHYDEQMSRVFFEELEMPSPQVNLGVGSGSQGQQTARMLEGLERVIVQVKADLVLLYGDTNSTLAGALVSAKMHIPIAHVEAGLRSGNRLMAEEINRIVTDHLSSLLFCPTETAVLNLRREGIAQGVHLVGDVMLDAVLWAATVARRRSRALERFGLEEGHYVVATVHRAENTDDPQCLVNIVGALEEVAFHETVIFPVHPRTRKCIANSNLQPTACKLLMIDPVGYLDMVALTQSARLVMTDSGGLQKEAYWLRVPCVTLRRETEWIETVQSGWNILAGVDRERILECVRSVNAEQLRPAELGEVGAARRCAAILQSALGGHE